MLTSMGRSSSCLDMAVQRRPEFPMLPRFGLRLFLPGGMDQGEYCGLGPWESYPDKRPTVSVR